MGKTLTQLKQSLGDWLQIADANDPQLPDSVREDCINIAQRRACLHDLSYNELSNTFPTVVGTPDYAKPAEMRPLSLWYIHPVNGGVVTLRPLNKDEFDQKYFDSTKTDYPCSYTVWGSKIYLGPTPSAILTIHRNYYGLLDDLSVSNTTNALTEGAWQYLLFQALAESEAFGIEDERIPLWQAKAEKWLTDIAADHQRARSTGRRSQNQEPG
jgi:hypothetical protein